MLRLSFKILLILLVLTSCNPCKRLWRRCPPVIIDSVRVDSITRLDTITLRYPGDTVRIGEETLHGFGIIIDTEKQKVTRKGKIIEFICKEDSLQSVISVLEYQLHNTKSFIKEKIVYVPQAKIPKWAWVTLVFSIITIIIIGLYIYFKIKQ